MTLALFVDFIIIILLAATLVYALRLNKQLTTLYQSRGELQSFIEGFTTSLNKAEISMAALRNSGESTFTAVHEALHQAQALKDDLTYLVERGEGIASNLDEAIRSARLLQKDIEDFKSDLSCTPKAPLPEEEKSELMRQLRSIR